MRVFRFPETETTVRWPRSRAGDVVISAVIPLREGRVPLCLALPRSGLQVLAAERPGGNPPSRRLEGEAGRLAMNLSSYAESASEWPFPPRYSIPIGSAAARRWRRLFKLANQMPEPPYILLLPVP